MIQTPARDMKIAVMRSYFFTGFYPSFNQPRV